MPAYRGQMLLYSQGNSPERHYVYTLTKSSLCKSKSKGYIASSAVLSDSRKITITIDIEVASYYSRCDNITIIIYFDLGLITFNQVPSNQWSNKHNKHD